MSTPAENLTRLSERDLKDHTAIFDLYVTVGRDIEYLSIKFGMDPDDVIHLLEGYGEKIVLSMENYDGDDPEILRSLKEFGLALDQSGRGRLQKLHRVLIEEYVGRFYPGIASGTENSWITVESYFDQAHPGWRSQLMAPEPLEQDDSKKRKVRNTFRLFG